MEFCAICDEIIHRHQEVVETPMGPCHAECFEDEAEETDEELN